MRSDRMDTLKMKVNNKQTTNIKLKQTLRVKLKWL